MTKRSDTRKKVRRAPKTRKAVKGGEVQALSNDLVLSVRQNASEGAFIKQMMDKYQNNPKALLQLFERTPRYYFVTIPDEEYKKGLTPFEYAIKLGNPEIVSGIWNGKTRYVHNYQIVDPTPYAVKLAEKYGNPAIANFLRNKGLLSQALPDSVPQSVQRTNSTNNNNNNKNNSWSMKNRLKWAVGVTRSTLGRAKRRITGKSYS